MSGRPFPSTSAQSVPMPACGLPLASKPDAGAIGLVDEGALAGIAVEEVAHRVVRDVDVGLAVAVVIAERHAETLAGRIGDAGLLRDVGERAVAVVAVQPIRHPVEHRRMAVHPISVFGVPAVRIVGDPVVEVVDDVEVEEAVAIDVDEAGAGAPLGGRAGDARGRRHVVERAVAVVPVERVRAERRHVEIEIAVVVEVSDGDAGLVTRGACPQCPPHRPAAVTSVKVPSRLLWYSAFDEPGAPLTKKRSWKPSSS